ncbi:NERD domain-containing protein [Candidatus Poribacteria bacterium]|nr:NERD domain-containing protein [Candidatus Poribacteria bacterium]
MLVKERDNHVADIAELQRLLDGQITAKQRFLIERELKCIGSGARGEENSAYYIDFRYKDSSNWAIIHDLRLEYRGFVAQIDHLLINRFLEIYVLESKNYYYGIKITPEGEFLAWNGKTLVALESPIEQNKRHIDLLEKVIQQPGFLPTKLGFILSPSFLNYVVVAPNSRVDRPAMAKFDTSMVIKADAFVAAIEKRLASTTPVGVISSLAKMVTQETLDTFARRLVRLHRPSQIDYAAKFGVNVVGAPTSKEHLEVLEGPDQKSTGVTPIPKPKPIEPNNGANASSSDAEKKIACEKCGAAVDAKVVFFCRMNKKKFDGKILCRSCQKAS